MAPMAFVSRRAVLCPRRSLRQLRQIKEASLALSLSLARESSTHAQVRVQDEVDPIRSYSPPFHSHHHDERIFSSPVSRARSRAPRPQPKPKIGRLVLVRHGQSEWNVTDPMRNLTARFTGWADIGLTQQGKDQAVAAGKAIQLAVDKNILPSKTEENGMQVPAIDVVFCSLLKRSEDTMNILLEQIHLAKPITENRKSTDMKVYQYPIPIIHSWRLNERHYGALVGLSKEGAERLYGKVRLTRWRDSWDVPPPPMPLDMVKRWGREDHCQPITIVKKGTAGRTCVFDPASVDVDVDNAVSKSKRGPSPKSAIRIVEHGGKKKSKISKIETSNDTNTAHVTSAYDDNEDDPISFMPPSESLRDTYQRFLPLWIQGIAPHLRAGRTVLVVGHANTIRSMLFAIDGDIVTKETSKKVKIPSALPLVYEFVDRDGSGCLIKEEVHDGNKDDFVYRVNGRECSKIVPGNLRVLKPNNDFAHANIENAEVRYQLNGTWVETDETKSASFCTELGQKMGEHDIA